MNQMSAYRALTGAVGRTVSVPPGLAEVATTGRSASVGVSPARNSTVPPGMLPSTIVALVIMAAVRRLSSNPVPDWRPPSCGVAYQLLCQEVAAFPSMASETSCGLSPWLVPAGPNAAAFAMASGAAGGAAGGVAVRVGLAARWATAAAL